MKSAFKLIIILLCLAGAGLLGGFFIATTSTDNVLIGVAIIAVGMILAFSTLIPAGKLYRQQSMQKEDRIKKLEEEVELLKNNNRL